MRGPTSPNVKTRARCKLDSAKTVSLADSKPFETDIASQLQEGEAKKILTKKRQRERTLPLHLKGSSPPHENWEEEEVAPPSKKKQKTAMSSPEVKYEEKRLRRFRENPPQSYLDRFSRANSQRMFVINRTRIEVENFSEEQIEIAGSTGNIYHVNICLVPSCTCPDNKKGNQCKHIIYILRNVLKVSSNLQYQLAFLSSVSKKAIHSRSLLVGPDSNLKELNQIFARAPPISSASASSPSSSPSSPSRNRKEISGDCPICFTAFEPDNDDIVWCKAACGNNIHKTCFEQWAKSKRGTTGPVTCVFCREPWQGDDDSVARIKNKGQLDQASLERIKTRGYVNEEGYVNVGDQLGLPSYRDSSTYHQTWKRRRPWYY